MWKLLQLVVFLSVYFTGIYYEWTPNGYVLGVLAFLAALLATVLLSWTLDKGRAIAIKQRDKRSATGRR
jgi:hypothetical protein